MLEANSLEPISTEPDATHRIETFDPKDDAEPPRKAVPLDGILARAHKLLKERTTEEIHAGAELINWLLRAPTYLKQSFGDIAAVADAPSRGSESTVCWIAHSDVVALARCVDFLSPPQVRALREAQWHELFAILALCYVDQVLREEAKRSAAADSDGPNIEDGIHSHKLWTSFSLARQSISLAEQLFEEIRSADKPKTKLRNPQREMLKSLVVNMAYSRYTLLSKRRAAHAVFNDLSASGRIRYSKKSGQLLFDHQHVLTNDDPTHRFAIWIGKARKKDGASEA